MTYRLMGRAHAWAVGLRHGEAGQGTVEYVGLILLLAGVLAAVVAFGAKFNGKELGETIVGKLKEAIEGTGAKKGGG
jgi:hypothetical protein